MTVLTDNPVSARSGRMPKDRLEDVMTVRFPEGDFARIDAVAGKNRRAKFIRDAVEAELRKRERSTGKPKQSGDT